ncbi:alpha/beta fold hydrolase [Mesorhizobium sp. CA9]|nr:alpha/beta fold hydrolase [Mesorhizobium sp. CA9]MBZ9839622.1 alpha/beta fold hydrolase [Mesorhizobium sp. CA3]MBZ9879825.1 alpha/beta fold hydrolase [Mesorhizobium sp. Ca11]
MIRWRIRSFTARFSVDGLPIFHCEAGDRDAPVILLLHGLPSSPRMYQPLLARLSDRYHLVEPDYPGFGHSAAPAPNAFGYTFDHLAEVITRFTEVLGLSRYSLFMQDYGGPVASAWRRLIPTACNRGSCSMPRTRASALPELPASLSGQTAQLMKRRSARSSCRWGRRAAATSAAIRTSSAMTLICGPMNSRFSADPARQMFRRAR